MATWQPNPQGIEQIVRLIKESKTMNSQTQQKVHEQFDQLSKLPDYNLYLVHILTMRKEAEDVRQVAGIMLKNNIQKVYRVNTNNTPENNAILNHIVVTLLQSLNDTVYSVRSTIGSILSTIASISTENPQALRSLLENLAKVLESTDVLALEGAIGALLKICEDSAAQLDTDELGRPLNFLIPRFISFFAHPHETIRNFALGCVVEFLELAEWPAALTANMTAFLTGVFKLALDPSKKIKRKVCRSFVHLLEHVEYIKDNIDNIIQYMLLCSKDEDENVALDACEFWGAFIESESCQPMLNKIKPILPGLVPVLLNGMVYSEMDRTIMDTEAEQQHADVPDRQQDINPSEYFHKSKTREFTINDNNNNNNNDDDENQDDDDEEEEEEDDFADSNDWNLRKSSASSLDVVSNVFGDDVLPILLPLIQEKLQPNKEWYVRESAILALGAIAEGCSHGMTNHLTQLIPYLVGILISENKPLVRCITCWTIGRYSQFVVSRGREYLHPTINELLNRMLDNNKKVQEAACSAFATLEEDAQENLTPLLTNILDTIRAAFKKYQAKNVLILYDAIGTLADAVGSDLNKPEYLEKLLPPLMNKWSNTDDTDKNLLPLLECLTSVATAFGTGFLPYVAEVFRRCLSLIEKVLQSHVIAAKTNEEAVDKEFVVCSLDLLSGLAEGLQGSIEPFIAQTNLLGVLFSCMKDESQEVRQSAFALVGDLAKSCVGVLRNALPQYSQAIIENLDPTYPSVCNNASWSLGEIAVKVGDQPIRNYVRDVLNKLIPIIKTPKLSRSLLENTAITIGRLGLVCPDIVAPYLGEFSVNMCQALAGIRDDIEKEHAFLGLCQMIRINPHGVFTAFPNLVGAIASWKEPTPTLQQEFYQILHGFKVNMEAQKWNDYFAQFPPNIRQPLQKLYNI